MLLIRCNIYTLFDGNRFETEFSSCIQPLIQILRHCVFISFVVERILDYFWLADRLASIRERRHWRRNGTVVKKVVLFLRGEFCEKNFREIAKGKDHFWNRVYEAYSWISIIVKPFDIFTARAISWIMRVVKTFRKFSSFTWSRNRRNALKLLYKSVWSKDPARYKTVIRFETWYFQDRWP